MISLEPLAPFAHPEITRMLNDAASKPQTVIGGRFRDALFVLLQDADGYTDVTLSGVDAHVKTDDCDAFLRLLGIEKIAPTGVANKGRGLYFVLHSGRFDA